MENKAHEDFSDTELSTENDSKSQDIPLKPLQQSDGNQQLLGALKEVNTQAGIVEGHLKAIKVMFEIETGELRNQVDTANAQIKKLEADLLVMKELERRSDAKSLVSALDEFQDQLKAKDQEREAALAAERAAWQLRLQAAERKTIGEAAKPFRLSANNVCFAIMNHFCGRRRRI